MRIKINRLKNRTTVSFHKFEESVNDLGDYIILFFWWEIIIYKSNNPWRHL